MGRWKGRHSLCCASPSSPLLLLLFTEDNIPFWRGTKQQCRVDHTNNTQHTPITRIQCWQYHIHVTSTPQHKSSPLLIANGEKTPIASSNVHTHQSNPFPCGCGKEIGRGQRGRRGRGWSVCGAPTSTRCVHDRMLERSSENKWQRLNKMTAT